MRTADERDHLLIAALRDGLPLAPRPYAALGATIAMGEAEVIERLTRMVGDGTIRRFGAIVRHHEVGYAANAMCVLDLPDDRIAAVGRALAEEPAVTLCYRRERRPPEWPYALYCMIHGRDRATVEAAFADILRRHALEAVPHAMLFSRRRFKQCAGRYGRAEAPQVGAQA